MRTTTDRAATTGTTLAVASVTSVQFGAAIAVHLFSRVGPVGAVALRLSVAALVMTAVTRPWRIRWSRRDLTVAAVFAGVFVVMNVSLYIGISHLPLGTAITLEFLGPLTLAVATAGSWRQRIWALPAGIGVLLLGGSLHLTDLVGVVAVLLAALAWVGYILTSRRMGSSEHGLAGLCLANAIAALIVLPAGLVAAGSALVHPSTLAIGAVVGVMSSALPYSLDLLALRRLPPAVFSVLTSLNPAVAGLAGFLVLHERLPLLQLAGVGLVVLASAGITIAERMIPRAAPADAAGPAGQPGAVSPADIRGDRNPARQTGAEVPNRAPAGRFAEPGCGPARVR